MAAYASGRVTIAIPRTPPSINSWLSKHWRVRHREKAEWELELSALAHAAGLERADRIEAAMTFRFRDKRRRDTGNFSSTLEKMLGDALKGQFLEDDDHQRFYVREARISPQTGTPETIIVLDWWRGEEAAAA